MRPQFKQAEGNLQLREARRGGKGGQPNGDDAGGGYDVLLLPCVVLG